MSDRVSDQYDVLVEPFPGMLLKEHLAGDSARAAQQCQRPTDDIGRNIAPDLGVIVGKPFLGDAFVGPIDPIGMGQRDGASLRLWRCCLALRDFPHDLVGGLILPQPPK